MKPGVLFDCESVIYSAGFASQTEIFHVGPAHLAGCTTLNQAQKWCLAGGEDPEEIRVTLEIAPLKSALFIVNSVYKRMSEALPHYPIIHTLLSDRTCFRTRIATIQPYKGNRTSAKPYWYEEIRKHLIEVRGAIFIEGLEADDLCSMYQCDDSIIAAIDKDLWTVPGAHYHWKTGELEDVSEYDASLAFYTQMLQGDQADHILGLPYCADETIETYGLHHSARKGCGAKAAELILADSDNAAEMYMRVKYAWLSAFQQELALMTQPAEMDGRVEQAVLLDILETGRLLYMTREINEDCSPVLWSLPDADDMRVALDAL